MFRIYFKTISRSFRKNSRSFSVNIFGLTIACVLSLLIIAYIRFEISYDKHFSRVSNIYQLLLTDSSQNTIKTSHNAPELLGKALMDDFPEVEASTGMIIGKNTFEVNGELVSLSNVIVSDSYFSMFDHRFLKGSPTNALSDANSAVLTKSAADRFFPVGEDPMGKTILKKNMNGDVAPFLVTAIIEDIPANTHFYGDLFTAQPNMTHNLDFNNFYAVPQYILLNDQSNITALEKKLPAFYEKYGAPKKTTLSFLPIDEIRLKSKGIQLSQNNISISDIRLIYVFAFIGFMTLAMASINYINLSIANSLQRIKEIGISKVLGASRLQIATQYIGESFLLYFLAMLLSIPLAILCWIPFAHFLNISDDYSHLLHLGNHLALLSLCIISSLLAGAYPAFFLSKMRPTAIFNQSTFKVGINYAFRNSLISIQFSIATFCMIMTLMLARQLSAWEREPLGFDQHQLISLPYLGWRNESTANAFKESLLNYPDIESVSITSLDVANMYGPMASIDSPMDSSRMDFAYLDADFDFLKTMGLELIEGRNFSESYPSDMTNLDSIKSLLQGKKISENEAKSVFLNRPLIITESVKKALQLSSPVIGKRISESALSGMIIGMVKDFKATSLKDKDPLLIIRGIYRNTGQAYIKIRNNNVSQSISNINTEWKNFFPNRIFEFQFVDERIQQLYLSENRMLSLFRYFSVFLILINVLGIYALVALLCQQKRKEIGIRIVLGARTFGIFHAISKNIFTVMALSFAYTIPIAITALNRWLENYAIKTSINLWVILFPCILLFAVCLFVILFHVRKISSSSVSTSISVQ